MALSDERVKYKKELYQAGVKAIAFLMEQLQDGEQEKNIISGSAPAKRELALRLLQIIESGKDS